MGIDVLIVSFLITEREIGLRLDPTERSITTFGTSASIGLIERTTFILWTKTAIGSMAVKVYNIAGKCCVAVIKHASPTVQAEVAHQLTECGWLQSIQHQLTAINQARKTTVEGLKASFYF